MPTYIQQDIVNRINAIDFFVSCGKPAAVSHNVLQVDSWQEAGKFAGNITWENKVLDESENIRQLLKAVFPDDYRFWNKMAAEAREYLKQDIKPKLEPFAVTSGLGTVLLDSVSWDLINILMIYSFDVSEIDTHFFEELVAVYEIGKYPCGWKGKRGTGSLVVF